MKRKKKKKNKPTKNKPTKRSSARLGAKKTKARRKPKRGAGKPAAPPKRKKTLRSAPRKPPSGVAISTAATSAAITEYAQGIDASVNTASQVACIAAAGKKFIARYYARGNKPKILRRAEALAISQGAMKIVAVWEDGYPTGPAYFTRPQGVSDALEAHARADEIRQPHNTAIYFAIDYDASAADVAGPIREYFRGVAEGLASAGSGAAWYYVGVYGSGAVCESILAAGLARYSWLAQSTGWRGYYTFMVWNIKQYAQTTLCTINVDPDDAKAGYGEFQVA
jgi:hypothetical protein